MPSGFEVNAPAVVKLFGEHVVMHGKPSVAAAINLFAKASVSENTSDKLKIILSDLGLEAEFSLQELKQLYYLYSNNESIQNFIETSSVKKEILPYAAIASRLVEKFDAEVLGKTISVSSEIKMQRGLASSAACSVAFALALAKSSNLKLADDSLIDIARDGDRIIHKNKNAGNIDVTTSFYGGVVVLDSKGIKKAEMKEEPKLMLIDTGPKKSTAETVRNVTELYETNPAKACFLADNIEACALRGLEALRTGDIEDLGKAMYENQKFLNKFGVSSTGLEKGVELSKEFGLFGAKLTGGGGGGILIAIPGKNTNISEFGFAAKSMGFEITDCKITKKGAKNYYKTKVIA